MVMPESEFVNVRRPSDAPFRVLPGDLVATKQPGYDLSLMRSLTTEGLTNPLVVEPLPGGRFKVVDGVKRLAVIRVLILNNKKVYDHLRRLARPASQVFSLIRCRISRAPSKPRSD
jgi:hypothetical protein